MADPADREEDITASPSPSEAMDQNDIYGEDGSIRQDYLAAIGAAIADRDVLFLREQVVPCMNRNLATCWRRSMPPSARHGLAARR
jgi:magnesium transporter